EADLGAFRPTLAGEHIAGRLDGRRLVPYATRADIDRYGAGHAPVLFYADDPVELFFLHIQGSGRALLPDRSVVRLAYAAQNGRPYTPIGRVLVANGEIAHGKASMPAIRNWLASHPQAAGSLMEKDQSFVFFKLRDLGDPVLGSPGAEGAPLTPQASLAVDPRYHPLGAPFYVDTVIPDAATPSEHDWHRLLIAQDIGGAIRGPARADLFFGYGKDAEAIAGRLKSTGRLYVLLPRALAAHTGEKL
ncbi:MAG: MltA domain-containing protein, partial [Alphaproteobacteria bacterium]|nr:MltA domain-containing protein [Alphaproteobacteria bacterium]